MEAARRDLAWLAGLALVLLVVFLWPYAVDGHRFGVGPDVPVYLWWTRVGANEGFSAIGSRPGAPALAAALAGTLSLSAAAVTAGLASAMGVAIGAAAAALVRASDSRAGTTWVVAGLLAGVFSVHLVAGYLANLVLAAPFLAAAACLAGRRRSWWGAALLLAGGGLAHPPFLLHAIVVLLGAAVLAWRAGGRDEARDIALAVAAGGLVAGAGVMATLAGPGPLFVETSRDGFLRRAGLDATLVDAYRERFRLRAARYVQWVAVPLSVAGSAVSHGFLRRFLASWLAVIAIGVPVGYATGWLPPDRLVTFGFAVPIAAALGLTWLRRRLGARAWLARAAVIGLSAWMIVGALLAWGKQRPFVSTHEVARTETAMSYAEAITNAGTPIVALVDDDDDTASFLAARAANILRAAADPGRAGDVYVFVGRATDFFEGAPTRRGSPEYTAISKLTLASIPEDPERVVLVIRQFYRGNDVAEQRELREFTEGIWVSRYEETLLRPVDEPRRLSWRPSNAPAITFALLSILGVLAVVGLGYARAVFDDAVTMIATAPAFGAAALTLAAVALDRLGLRLNDLPVAFAASALAGLGGLALFLVVKRQRDRQTAA